MNLQAASMRGETEIYASRFTRDPLDLDLDGKPLRLLRTYLCGKVWPIGSRAMRSHVVSFDCLCS